MKKRSKIIIISVASFLLILGITLFFVFNPYFFRYYFGGETFNINEEPQDDITIMSFNARYKNFDDKGKRSWEYRADLVIKVIKQEKPDIIGFQEAQTIHEDYFKKHLHGYDFKEAYANNSKEKEGALILYRNDMFDKTNEGLFWLSETPDVPSVSWNSACTRVASFVVLKHKYTNKQYAIINTHLDHVSREARIKGMGVIIDKIESLDLKTPILMGDMNDVESSATYRRVTEYGFNDALKVAGESYIGTGATFHHFGESLDNPRIDFFFTDQSLTINNYHVVDKTFDNVYPSNHFPIVIDIEE